MADRRLAYVPALDGIRALAVGSVLLFHAGLPFAPGGFLGVSTFFTLSGFLIATLLLREYNESGSIDLRTFWVRRFRRLMPAALLTLLGVAILGATIATPEQIANLRSEGLSTLFYVANWNFIARGQSYWDLFAQPSPLQHFWSLAIEEQFYAVFPLMMAGGLMLTAGRRRGLVAGSLVLIVMSIGLTASLHEPGADPSRVYFGTDTRAAELLIGVLLALVWRDGSPEGSNGRSVVTLLGWVGLLSLLATWALSSEASAWLFEGGLALHAVGSAAVIAAAMQGGGVLARMLGYAPLRELGRISYGVYVYHWPLFLWLDEQRTGLGILPLTALRFSVTLAVALASHRLIEQPIRSGTWLQGRRGTVCAACAVALVAIALILVTAVPPGSEIVPSRAEQKFASPDTDANAVRVLVVGDSVAYGVAGGLKRWGLETGRIEVRNSARINCGIARGATRMMVIGPMPPKPRCQQWAKTWSEVVASFEPRIVVVLAGYWEMHDVRIEGWSKFRSPGDPVFDSWLIAELRELSEVVGAGDARVVWLTAPCAGREALSPRQKRLSAFEPGRFARFNQLILPSITRSSTADDSIIDLDRHVCPGGQFQMKLGETERARPDGLHFSRGGADVVARWLGPELLDSAEQGAAATTLRAH